MARGRFACGQQQLLLQGLVGAAEGALKGEEVEPEHIEGSHAGGEKAHRPEQRITAEGDPENLVFAPEARQGGDATDGHASDEEGDGGYRHVLAQAAHQTHVLGQHRFVAHHLFHGMDHRSRAKEKHRLEEGMGDQMKHAGNGGAAAHGQHHVAQLGNGAVGQPLLEIHLGEGNRGPQEAGDRAHHSNHQAHMGEQFIEGFQARH